jgi:PAT family beta-lactamase induction signal transducer AmpG
MAAGWLEDHMGYVNFFWWVMGCCIVTLIVTAFLKIDPEYGKKQ